MNCNWGVSFNTETLGADGRPLYMRLTPVQDFTNEHMRHWASRHLTAGCHVVSDGTRAFAQVRQAQATHERYLAEFCWRFNRRFDMPAMLPRLLKALVTTGPLPLKLLRVSEVSS